MTTSGSDYFPKTASGRLLCFFAGAVCERGMWLFDGNPGNIFCESGCERAIEQNYQAPNQFKLCQQKLLHCELRFKPASQKGLDL